MKCEDVAIPFRSRGNRQYLTEYQVADDPAAAEFIRHFPNCFEWVPWLQIFLFYPDGDAPC